MPRKKRVWKQEMCHHIMFRGVDGRALFFDDQDRIKFLLLLQEATELHRMLRNHYGTVSRLAARVTKQPRLQASIKELISSF